ncbi:putative imidazolonepropionase isoform X2 [Arapaima gigas]
MCVPQLGAELGALAISHLEEVTDEGIAAMAKSKTAAVLLPTTAYILRLPQPRARDMLDAGVIVALGSDFNPNAYCCSMVSPKTPSRTFLSQECVAVLSYSKYGEHQLPITVQAGLR